MAALLASIAGRVGRMGRGQAVLWLLLANLIVSVPLMAAMEVNQDADREDRTDLYLFRDRAGTILDGGWLYRDTDHVTLTPPLINYLLTVPLLAGDALVVWELYLSLWTFAVGALLCLALRPLHRVLAFTAGLFYVSSPFGYATSVAMVQDDTIVPFFVAASLAALLASRHALSGFWSGLGMMVKAWPGIAAPVIFLSAPTPRRKLAVAAAGFGVALAISLPFLVFVPDAFVEFLRFYLLGRSPDGDFEGLSLWRFLWLRGWGIPQQVNLAALLLGLLFVWWATWRGRVAPVTAFAASYLALLVAYPKLHFGYYLLGLLVALPWAVVRWQRLVGLALASGAARLAHLYWREEISTAGAGIFGALALAAALIGFWAWWLWTVWRAGDFRAHWRVVATTADAAPAGPASEAGTAGTARATSEAGTTSEPPASLAGAAGPAGHDGRTRGLAADLGRGATDMRGPTWSLGVALAQTAIGLAVAGVTWLVRAT